MDGEDVNGGVEHVFGPRSTTAIGSLPHRDPVGAATCAFAATTLPCIPSLPRRSPAEGMVAQAVGSLPGVTLGQYGSISIDPSRFGSDIVVGADLRGESFGGLRAFLDLAARRDHRGPVKWQFIGPVTLGLSLRRAGAPSSVAFRLAVNAVRAHLDAIATAVACRLPHSRQIVLVDEPSFGSLMTSSFPIAPDVAIDLVSEAMSVLEHRAVVGLHCCDRADIPSLLATGPRLLSLPVTSAVPDAAGYLQRYLDRGGVVVWGAVATDGPVLNTPDRSWRALAGVWRDLIDRGVDADALVQRSIISPQCGLGLHSRAAAQRVLELTSELAERVAAESRAGLNR